MRWLLMAIALLIVAPAVQAFERSSAPVPAVVGVADRHLDAQYWVQRQPHADRVILDADAIAAQNARLQQQDRSVHDIEQLPARFSAAQVREWIAPLSAAPTRTLFDAQRRTVAAETLASLQDALALDRVPDYTAARYGLVAHRADLRTFPTRLRVFSSPGDTDIDRFQESALFPGTPVVVIHESRDGQWLFAISRLYAAWIEKRHVALGGRETVFGYGRKQPSLIVTGATVRTVYNPEQPGVSELQLDMGVRVPLLADWPADKPVNGQHPYTSHVIQLPVRGDDGALTLLPALLPRTADVATQYLPLTPANLLTQSFKFLGERYGWGHAYNTRDCSGFVSEVYRSFGVELPRNTRDQGVSPALNRIAFDENDSHEKRLQALRTLQVGDLIYIPGHVMMVIGQEDGNTYLIHDTTGITYRSDGGDIVRAPLNSVAVTPLEPLLFNGDKSFVDRIYSIQRIRP
ncbi:SH3 domain-containing protein [Pseudoxanthomonas wuyuanensis]|uniref:NlpC/P60 family protein n=1 Tax=Pseudoxanthomonas wuyuanensis TaxID=1073196 RepID=A0A286D9R8_9GAMM|nr:SH3 domain-containing protein [Pseudoxanthomonas wuyuanensis]KAF1719489.1 NlpC-P60 family protein [Pseudoxanthomonas wuyuanensis]SOD55405.1 NlpC/P60 family protein [Pseudoxanthomonas wuyuanensis]